MYSQLGEQILKKVRLALVGCGAIAEAVHLPVIQRSEQVVLTALVDKRLHHAQQLASSYNVAVVVEDYREILDKVDAAIVTVPNYLHAPISIDLLRHGIHVLVEKPMALSTAQCDQMIEAAECSGARLAVGLICRFYESSQFVKQVLENGWLGRITNFDLRQGTIYRWAAVSDYPFRKEAAGGGVLMDIGVHDLDLLLWWLGDYETVEYYDDAMGGVEADCKLHLHTRCGASGTVELSRTRQLRNSCIIQGERGTLEVGTWSFAPSLRLSVNDESLVLQGTLTPGSTEQAAKLRIFGRQLDNFVDSIRGHDELLVSGYEGRRALELIERCYAQRQPLELPWMQVQLLQ